MARNARPKPIDAIELNAATQGRQRKDAPDVPPDGGYGWVVVASCVTFNSFTWGVISVTEELTAVFRQWFGVYLSEYLSSDLFPEARPLDYGGFNFAFAMLLAPLATYLTRKFGKRSVLLCGCVLQCSGYVAATFATKVWHLYLSQGLLVGCGIGFIVIPSMTILSHWFSQKRSLANVISPLALASEV
ncbi:MAG: hypothetical protein Q9198_002668 [Flavoplaca austrocitrina]